MSSERINNLFTCPTCKKTLNAEGLQICSNPFHLVIPKGYRMTEGKLIKIGAK